ncbi:uncharacterized protein LOC144345457 [Saccoglossus kowalevskii]
MASFFRKLSRTKSADISDDSNNYGGSGESDPSSRRRSVTRDRSGSDKTDNKRRQGEIKAIMTDHGLARTPIKYPTYICHYLGRMPAGGEFGRENVEGPVDSLCKLRERQKLQKVIMKFDKEGLHFREIGGPFNKPKRDGIRQFIPLHHVSYGVGSLIHPYVFACITRIMDDPEEPSNQVLVLHAFLCDKPETTRSVTYWQLQSYIEAYEDLKRKKLMRKLRKRAKQRAKLEAMETMSTHTTTTTLSNDSQDSRKIEDVESIGSNEETGQKERVNDENDKLPDVTNISEKQSLAKGTTTKTDSSFQNVDAKIEPNESKSEETDEPFEDVFADDTKPDPDNAEAEQDAEGGEDVEEDVTRIEGKNARDIAFEKRILELQAMFDVNPEEIKHLLLRDNPTIK